jgi:hypothetical protein
MKFLQKFFLICGLFCSFTLFGCDLDEALLKYIEYPAPSVTSAALCVGADCASILIGSVGPGTVCGILGAGSIHCQISGTVLSVIFGLSSIVLTPLAGYLWYDYRQEIRRAENTARLAIVLKALVTENLDELDQAHLIAMSDLESLRDIVLIAHKAGYFIFKTELRALLRSHPSDEAKELKQELKANEKIGCLAGLEISQVVEKIRNIHADDLINDKKNFALFFDRINKLIVP